MGEGRQDGTGVQLLSPPSADLLMPIGGARLCQVSKNEKKNKYKKNKKDFKKEKEKNSLDEHSDKTRLESWLLGPRQTAPFTSLASVSHD